MDELRAALTKLKNLLDWLPDPLVALMILGIAVLVALALHRWVSKLARRALSGRYPYLYSAFNKTSGLTRLALLIMAMIVAIPVAPLKPEFAEMLARLMGVAVIGLTGWAAIIALHIAAALYLRRFSLDSDDNLLARKHNTQVQVLSRSLDVVLVLLTLGAALMTFPAVRQYGLSLFASAGIAGIIAGLAARPVLSNLMAGVQLAMTQPIRLYDGVTVENEYGTVEEITSTYVVVKLWGPAADDRAADLLHRKAIPELDTGNLGSDRQRYAVCRLRRAGRGHPREIQRDPQAIRQVGRANRSAAGH
jgi:small-conductance mechanosensitive channel